MEPRQFIWGLLVLLMFAPACNKANKGDADEKGTSSEDATLQTDSGTLPGDTHSGTGVDTATHTGVVTDTASETVIGPNPDGTCAYDCVSACTSMGGVRREGFCTGDLLCCDLTPDRPTDLPYTDADVDSDGDADTDADGDMDADTDTDADTDADTDTDTDVDTDPEACRTNYMSKSDDWCELSMDCPDGYKYANCDLWDRGSEQCWCETNNGSFNFGLPDGAGNDPCEFAMNLCDDISPQNIGEPECGSLRESMEDWYCEVSQECTQTVQLTPDITTELNTWNDAWCERDYYYYEDDLIYIDADADADSDADGDADGGDSGWYCYCSTNNKSMNYRVSSMPDGSAPCGVVFDACQSGVDIVTEGDVVCDKRSQSQDPGRYCSVGYECEQSGTLAGAEITMSGYMDASCNRNSSGEWECYCYGGSREETFTLSGTDAWAVCEEAGPKCMDMYTSEELVQSGGGGYYPDRDWDW